MFKEKFKNLLSSNELNPKQFAEKSNIPYSTVRGWIALGRLPDYQAIIKIAKFFNITTDELLDAEIKAKYNFFENFNLTEEEKKLLKDIRLLNRDEKNMLKGFLTALSENKNNKR